MQVFDPISVTLSGPMLLEASAGTGKTYSLMHIFLRLLVEKRFPLAKILLVTFTNAATYELRSRLRAILTDISEKLSKEDVSLKDFPTSDVTLKSQMERWSDRYSLSEIKNIFEEALAHIDDAAIFTIHSFCTRMLQDFVFSSQGRYNFQKGDGTEEAKEAIESFLRKRLPRVLNKELASTLAKCEGWKDLLEKLGQLPYENPSVQRIQFLPGKGIGEADKLEADAVFRDFVENVPTDFSALKYKNRIFTPDDLLAETQRKIFKPKGGVDTSFTQAIRKLFDAVLVDEFQDTDPIQYSIFDSLFLEDKENLERPVIFVGDPKQSIYGFRNSDLNMYFNAKKKIEERNPNNIQMLNTNYRSTPGIVLAINEIFSYYNTFKSDPSVSCSTSFLDNRLPYENINFDPSKPPLFQKVDDKLRPLPAFELWSNIYDCDSKDWGKSIPKENMAIRVANDIANLLNNETTYKGKPLLPSDIAILVNKRADADILIRHLNNAGIKTLIQSKDDVLMSEEADDIVKVLQAMDNPADLKFLNIARSTKIFSDTLKRIRESEEGAQESRQIIEETLDYFEEKGIIAAFAHLFRKNQTENHLLKLENGDRALTNYQHILELLNNESGHIKSVSGFIRWIKAEQEQNNGDTSEDRQLRRETDNDLVRILTIHASKGLQYPVVYLWDACKTKGAHESFLYKAEPDDDEFKWIFSLDKSRPDPKSKKTDPKLEKTDSELEKTDSELEKTDSALKPEYEEELRKFYVALTRATARLVLPYCLRFRSAESKDHKFGIFKQFKRTVLPQSLIGQIKPSSGDIIDSMNGLRRKLSRDPTRENPVIDNVVTCLKEINKVNDLGIDNDFLEHSYEPFKFISINPNDGIKKEKKIQSYKPDFIVGTPKKILNNWTITSFTGLSREIEPIEDANALDEPTENSSPLIHNVSVSKKDANDVDLLAFSKGFMKANEFGNLFHKLMELINFDDPKELNERTVQNFCKRQAALNLTQQTLEERKDPDLVLPVEGLYETVENILNVPFPSGDFNLSKVRNIDRVSEMDFLISTGKVSKGRTVFQANQLGQMLQEFDPKYSGLTLSDKQLKGYLTGSIDLVFEKDEKFWIVDWKTNTLSDRPSDYTADLVNLAMESHHYRLQYLLYLVALKRYLEARLRCANGYALIGGAAYYFVRGIRKDKPEQGIVFDRPKNALIECLDDFLAKGYSQEKLEQYLEQAQGESR